MGGGLVGARTFTIDGQEYELIEFKPLNNPKQEGSYLLKPIKAVEKPRLTFGSRLAGDDYDFDEMAPDIKKKYLAAVEKEYWGLWFKPYGEGRAALFAKRMTPPQAQKVAEAIEALMAYILRPYPINPEYEEDDVKFVEADEARKAFQEDI